MQAGVIHFLSFEDGVGILLAVKDAHDSQQVGAHQVVASKPFTGQVRNPASLGLAVALGGPAFGIRITA